MTAFNEVLTAEQEAERSINAAKEEMVAAVAAAHTEHRTRMETETVKLNEAEQAAIAAHQVQVNGLVKKINDEVSTQVSAVKQRFVSHKAELISAIKQSF